MLPGKFNRENMRLVVLDILKEGELHGYGIAERIEEIYGVKRPSPGLIYPLLSSLKGEGFVEVVERGKRDRKTYRITPLGVDYLKEKEEDLKSAQRILRSYGEFQRLGGREMMEAVKLLIERMDDLEDEGKMKISELLREFSRKLRLVVEFGDLNE